MKRSMIVLSAAGMLVGCLSFPAERPGSAPDSASGRGGARFVATPTAAAAGAEVKVSFEVSAPTDVGVAVLDGDGRIVRHLAAGMLGPKAPAPLQANSLAQELLWDRKDDAGQPVPAGAYKVRVSLGLKGELDRFIEWEPPTVTRRSVRGLAADAEGNMYFLMGGWTPDLLKFSREGRYLKTLLPPAADDLEGRPGLTVERHELTGELVPRSQSPNMFAGLQQMGVQTLQVCGGRLVAVMTRRTEVPGRAGSRKYFVSLGPGGRPAPGPGGSPYGPALTPHEGASEYLAVDRAGETVYLAGCGSDVVYGGKWTDDALKPFFGEKDVAGGDAAHLDDARGLAVDGQGRVLICDYRNDRIQVVAPDGKLAKSLAVPGPDQVAVHPKTGAVYVFSVLEKSRSRWDPDKPANKDNPEWDDYNRKQLVKFDGVDGGKVVAKLVLPERKITVKDPRPLMALDSSGAQARVWFTCVNAPWDPPVVVDDEGGELKPVASPIPMNRYANDSGWSGWGLGVMAADRGRDEVYWAGPGVWGSERVCRFSGHSGKMEVLDRIGDELARTLPAGTRLEEVKEVPSSAKKHVQVWGMAVDAESRLYLRLAPAFSGMPNWIRRYDREGRRAPFGEAGEMALTQPSHGYHPGGFAVARNGDIYAIDLVPGGKHRGKPEYNVMNVYGPDGQLKRAGIVPWLSSAAWGPRLDSRGNLYVTDALAPASETTGKGSLKNMHRGSLLKFEASGGRIVLDGDAAAGGGYVTREYEGRFPPAKLEGVHWVHYGVSSLPWGHCICQACIFDLDGFDRAFVQDEEGYCLKVLDSGGNLIAAMGGYGNPESKGPGSAVAAPKVPFRSMHAVATTDRAVYVFDSQNRRVVRIRLEAQAAEVAEVRL